MFHWESNKKLEIKMWDWGCVSHMGEYVESLWHIKFKDAQK